LGAEGGDVAVPSGFAREIFFSEHNFSLLFYYSFSEWQGSHFCKSVYFAKCIFLLCRKRILVWPKAGVVPRDLMKRVRREEKGFKAKGKRYSMVPYMDVGINDKTLK
jgi:hypothetical protein